MSRTLCGLVFVGVCGSKPIFSSYLSYLPLRTSLQSEMRCLKYELRKTQSVYNEYKDSFLSLSCLNPVLYLSHSCLVRLEWHRIKFGFSSLLYRKMSLTCWAEEESNSLSHVTSLRHTQCNASQICYSISRIDPS
jgi:hypothetical protein